MICRRSWLLSAGKNLFHAEYNGFHINLMNLFAKIHLALSSIKTSDCNLRIKFLYVVDIYKLEMFGGPRNVHKIYVGVSNLHIEYKFN